MINEICWKNHLNKEKKIEYQNQELEISKIFDGKKITLEELEELKKIDTYEGIINLYYDNETEFKSYRVDYKTLWILIQIDKKIFIPDEILS